MLLDAPMLYTVQNNPHPPLFPKVFTVLIEKQKFQNLYRLHKINTTLGSVTLVPLFPPYWVLRIGIGNLLSYVIDLRTYV